MIEVTDVSGYMLNAESHLGCRSFHDVTFFINVLALFFCCLLNRTKKVFLIKTSITGSIYQKALLKNNIIEMSVSHRASFVNLSKASMI